MAYTYADREATEMESRQPAPGRRHSPIHRNRSRHQASKAIRGELEKMKDFCHGVAGLQDYLKTDRFSPWAKLAVDLIKKQVPNFRDFPSSGMLGVVQHRTT